MYIVDVSRSKCRSNVEMRWEVHDYYYHWTWLVAGVAGLTGRRQEVSVYAWENINDSNRAGWLVLTTGYTAQVIKLWTSEITPDTTWCRYTHTGLATITIQLITLWLVRITFEVWAEVWCGLSSCRGHIYLIHWGSKSLTGEDNDELSN